LRTSSFFEDLRRARQSFLLYRSGRVHYRPLAFFTSREGESMKLSAKLVCVTVVSLSTLSFAQDEGGRGVRAQGALLDASTFDTRPMMLSLHVMAPYAHFGFGGLPLGVGASFYIPLVNNGFIPPLNEEFGIDFGLDAVGYFGYYAPFALYVPVCAVWKFHILENLEAYAKLGFMPRLWFGYATGFFYPDVYSAVGIHYMFSKSFGLKAEVGYPGIRAGVVLAF
jgi:hypothetical protein